MQRTLEVVVVPVADVDRAKAFYEGTMGFHVDHDTAIGGGMRIVQLTPPGSGCSVVIGEGIVPDIDDEHIVPSPTMTVFSVPRADSRLEAEPRKTQWTVRF